VKLLTLLFGGLMSVSAFAMELGDAKAPTQAQLNLLLSGNTVQGEWDGRPFTQYFAATGSTRYREGDGPQSQGTWRANVKGQYCSVWPPSPTEACYDVLVKGNNLLWKSGGKLHPSVVSEGDTF
jgi:hypothetical protein